jgi:HSP20 family protein
MSLTRYEPWDVLDQLHRQLNRVFEGQNEASGSVDSSATADWIPAADIAEYKDRWVLQFDIPGVNTSAVEITLDQGVLTISGEREKDAVGDEVSRQRVERPHGRFHRRFTLPDTIDASNVQAKGRGNGVLEVTIPKQAKAQPRRIEVTAH